MKWFLIALTTLFLITAALYGILFTPPGNRLLTPVIEKKISAAVGMSVKLERFKLDMHRFEIVINLTPDNTLEADGTYALFSRTLSARYRVRLGNLAELAPLTKTPMQGAIATDGTVTGPWNALHVAGSSDIADSRTTYSADILDDKPQNVSLAVKDAVIAKLLFIMKKPAFADGALSLDVHLPVVDPEALEGKAHISVGDGRFDAPLLKKAFNVTVPKSTFTFKGDATMQAGKADYSLAFDSSLAHINSKGTVVPDTLATDLVYRISFNDLALLKPLTNAPLRGPFATSGSIKGDQKQLNIDGTSDVASSQTAYHTTLKDLSPGAVTVTVRHAQLSKLLYLAGQEPLAEGNLNADIQLANLDPKALKGTADLTLADGKLDKELIRKRYGTALPDTALHASMHADLDKKNVAYRADIDSSIGRFHSKGTLVPETVGMDLAYSLDIKELGLLKGLTGVALRGPLAMNGTLKGDKKQLDAVVSSNVAQSRTRVDAVLKAFKPVSANLDVKHLKLKKLLYLVGQPQYADADVTLTAALPNLEPGNAKGTVRLDVINGIADKAVVAKAFEWPDFKGASFALHSMTTLKGNNADSKADITSNLFTLHAEPVRYDMAKKLLTADYTLDLPDLNRLYFVTGRPLRGALKAKGDLRYDKTLLLHADSAVAGGNVKATFKDKKLHADLAALKTKPLLHILTYPEVFDGTLDGTFDYNTGDKKGVMKADLSQGHFTRNGAFDLLKQYSKLNLYDETFKGNTLANINDKLVDANLQLRSNRSSISTQHAKIDTAKKTIDAKVHVDAEKTPIDFRLKGSLDRPGISVDAKKLLEQEAGKQINKLLNNLFK